MSYLEFGAGDISSCSFTFGRAFHCLPKPPFSWFAQVTAWALAFACASCQGLIIHSVLQGNSPTLKYWPPPFLPRSPPKILNLSDFPFMSTLPPAKFWRTQLPHLKCTLIQKRKDTFFKETKDFISNIR